MKKCEFNFFKYEAISVTCSPPTLPSASCFYLLGVIIQTEEQKLSYIYTPHAQLCRHSSLVGNLRHPAKKKQPTNTHIYYKTNHLKG